MCGRFTITRPERVAAKLHLDNARAEPGRPRYNIAPMQSVPAVVPDRTGRAELRNVRWGFRPHWADDTAAGDGIINARAETVAVKPAFRDAFRTTRCLVPADGFFEWRKTPGGKQPLYIRVDEGAVFVFAGLYSVRHIADAPPAYSCTIITTEPNSLLKPIHNRMPVILPEELWDTWLDPHCGDMDRLLAILRPFPAERMSAHAVSNRVNSPANDDPGCIEPA